MCGVEQHLQHIWGMVAVKKALFCQFQTQHMTNDGCGKSFDTHVAVLKTYEKTVAQHPIRITKMLKSKGLISPTPEEKVLAQLEVHKEYLDALCSEEHVPSGTALSKTTVDLDI